jgi:MFS family permease
VSFVSFAAVVWCAEAKAFHSFVGARVVSAFTFAASEGLAAAISSDLFFLHERGWWTGVYLISLMGGVSLGGLMSGFIITALGWRWHFWVPNAFAELTL